jgi:hypothetical protein
MEWKDGEYPPVEVCTEIERIQEPLQGREARRCSNEATCRHPVPAADGARRKAVSCFDVCANPQAVQSP